MQHVSARKWPEAAWIKTKNQIGLHSVNFRVCSANFRACSGNFRVCFWRDCVQKMECPNSSINTAAKQCHSMLKAFNHPINSRWVQATMPHHKILWWDLSWSSDTCGNYDSFPQILICSLASWRPKRPNKRTMPAYSKYEDVQKTSLILKIYQKMYLFQKKLLSKQMHKSCILVAA